MQSAHELLNIISETSSETETLKRRNLQLTISAKKKMREALNNIDLGLIESPLLNETEIITVSSGERPLKNRIRQVLIK